LNNPFYVVRASDPPQGSPFSLQSDAAYQRWREAKLNAYPVSTEDLVVEVDNPLELTEAEADAMLKVSRKTNMVIYAGRTGREDKEIPRAIGDRFGLRRLDSHMLADDDGITSLQVVPSKSQRGYIPYSNKRLLWHTDGYYHGTDSRIGAFVLHCVSPAVEGGQNSLMDHEIAYILMRDANPDHVRALMSPDAMTIPPNTEAGTETRAAVTGPVFSVDPIGGNLHMRYTARTRSIAWKQDAATQEAVKFLEHLLAGESPYMFRHTLGANQGLLCNNVLHNRTAFTDDVGRGMARLVYRARYHDRIRGTNFNEIYG